MSKQRFKISGMHCAACAASVQRAVGKLPGASEVYVNIATNEMTLAIDEQELTTPEIIATVKRCGFEATLDSGSTSAAQTTGTGLDDLPATAELPLSSSGSLMEPEHLSQWRQVRMALIFAAILAYVGMHDMLRLPFPDLGQGNLFLQFLLLLPILHLGRQIFRTGFLLLFRLAPNMDSLIALGTGAATVYSLMMIILPHGNEIPHVYFESAGMIIALILLGRYLENRSRHQASGAIRELMELAPATANLIGPDQTETVIPASRIQVNDLLRVKPGERYPTDGVVVEGKSSANEAMISGESIPIDKEPGSKITGASVNLDGTIVMQATQIGENTVLSRIIRMVAEAQGSRPPIARLADVISGYFVWVVLFIAAVSFVAWALSGAGLNLAVQYALAVLVIACPCALGLATPIALIVGIGRGAGLGILIKSGPALEAAGKVQTVIFDKTGTLTGGSPDFTGMHLNPQCPFAEDKLFAMIAALEQQSNHPLGLAVVREAEKRGLKIAVPDEAKAEPGNGIEGKVEGHQLLLGNERFLKRHQIKLDNWTPPENRGQSLILVAVDNVFQAVIAVADQPRPDAAETVARLHQMGIKTVMLTGDRPDVAREIAGKIGMDEVRAELMPSDKALIVKEIQQEKGVMVAMVGDGINDAPALSQADVGIAIGTGTDVAMESADIVLTGKHLMDVAAALSLSRATLRIVKQNLFWALAFNSIGIPVAAGLLVALFSRWSLHPVFAAMAMACSSLAVVTNALRLRRWQKY